MIRAGLTFLALLLVTLSLSACILDWETGPKMGDRIRFGWFPATVIEGTESETAAAFENTTSGLKPLPITADRPEPIIPEWVLLTILAGLVALTLLSIVLSSRRMRR